MFPGRSALRFFFFFWKQGRLEAGLGGVGGVEIGWDVMYERRKKKKKTFYK